MIGIKSYIIIFLRIIKYGLFFMFYRIENKVLVLVLNFFNMNDVNRIYVFFLVYCLNYIIDFNFNIFIKF